MQYLLVISQIFHTSISSINIIGMANSMAVCILLLLWVQDEIRFDRFHKKGESFYRSTHARSDCNVERYNHSTIPCVLAPILGVPINGNCGTPIILVSYFVSNNRLLRDIPALETTISFVSEGGDRLSEQGDPLNVVVTKKVKSISRHSSVQSYNVTPYLYSQGITTEGWSPEGSTMVYCSLFKSLNAV